MTLFARNGSAGCAFGYPICCLAVGEDAHAGEIDFHD